MLCVNTPFMSSMQPQKFLRNHFFFDSCERYHLLLFLGENIYEFYLMSPCYRLMLLFLFNFPLGMCAIFFVDALEHQLNISKKKFNLFSCPYDLHDTEKKSLK